MKKIVESITKICLIFFLICTFGLLCSTTVQAENDIVPLGADNISITHKPDVYLVNTDTGYMRVVHSGQKIVAEYYDDSFQILTRVSVPLELETWGGFYAGENAYYIAQGQSNTAEDDTAEVIRVVKYDKSWNKVGVAKITGDPDSDFGKIRYPFDAGNVNMTEYKGYLYLVTGHQGYVDPNVGQGHQGYLMVKINESDMTGSVTDYNLGHSFSQYITHDDKRLYVVQQNEGGRQVTLSKCPFDTANRYNPFDKTDADSISVFLYGGTRTTSTAIACRASVDGITENADNVFTIGTSINQTLYDSATYQTPFNLYLTVTPKSDFTEASTTFHWMSEYTKEKTGFYGTNITKINDNRFLLMWEITGESRTMSGTDILSSNTLHYVFLDGSGNKISQEYTAAAPCPVSQPIVKNGRIVFTASLVNIVNFYSIDAQTGAFAENKSYQVAGENSTWSLNNGVLTISGTGELSLKKEEGYRPTSSDINFYSCSNADYNSMYVLNDQIKEIVIGDGITGIPAETFAYFSHLQSVTIGNGVTYLGDKVFYWCHPLTYVTVPSSVTSIGKDCFASGYIWGDGSSVVYTNIITPTGSYAEQYAIQNKINYGTSISSFQEPDYSNNSTYNYDDDDWFDDFYGQQTVSNPKTVSYLKVISKKSKQINVKWKKVTGIKGYQIQYATDRKFKKNKKTVRVNSAKTTSKTIKKLKSKKIYYVRMRTYKKVGTKTYYSKWTAMKKIKVK